MSADSCLGGWVWILPRSAVDSTWTTAHDNSTYQRNSESWRIQLRYRSAGDHVQNRAVLYRHRPSRMYAFDSTKDFV